jgi:hypothetical protein
MSSNPNSPLVFEFGDTFASPSFSPPTSGNAPFTGYTTRGLLRKNNLSDVPDGETAITNILTNAFGVPYTYNDIAIINGIADTSFDRTRVYNRLYGADQSDLDERIVILDGEKPISQGTQPTAVPLQTINNQFSEVSSMLGSPSTLLRGDGLVGRYYSWTSIFGDADELTSTGGGTYVNNQDSYGSPNNFLQAAPSEIFFGFQESDLRGAAPVETSQEWNNGVWNFGERGLHPTFDSKSGVVQYKGYYHTGIPAYRKRNARYASVGLGHNQRFYIVSNPTAFDTAAAPFMRTTVPVIWKFWELDSDGNRLSEEPTINARFAPKMFNNTPAYSFTSTANSRIKINDKLFNSPDSNSPAGFSVGGIGQSYLVAPLIDDTPMTKRPVTIGFSADKFYETEIYFILSPRVGENTGNKSVFLSAHEPINSQMKFIRSDSFFSKNPLKQAAKGTFHNFINNRIRHYGSNLTESPLSHIDKQLLEEPIRVVARNIDNYFLTLELEVYINRLKNIVIFLKV